MSDPKHVLVAWGSKHGGTEGLGQLVAARLESRGFRVHTASVDEIRSLEDYDAIVLGGALYANRWPAPARRFVRRHLSALRAVPVWLFSSGPLDDSASERAIPPTPEVAVLAGRIGALGHVTFGGRLEADVEGFAAAMAEENAGDWRDPEAVRQWADAVADELPTASPGTVVEAPARSLSRLLLHGIGAALAVAGLLTLSPLVGGRTALILHGVLAPVITALVAIRYFRPAGSRGALPTAFAFTILVVAAEVAVIDARLYAAEILDGVAFWLPVAAVFTTTWATGSLMATLPWGDPGKRADEPPPGAAVDTRS